MTQNTYKIFIALFLWATSGFTQSTHPFEPTQNLYLECSKFQSSALFQKQFHLIQGKSFLKKIPLDSVTHKHMCLYLRKIQPQNSVFIINSEIDSLYEYQSKHFSTFYRILKDYPYTSIDTLNMLFENSSFKNKIIASCTDSMQFPCSSLIQKQLDELNLDQKAKKWADALFFGQIIAGLLTLFLTIKLLITRQLSSWQNHFIALYLLGSLWRAQDHYFIQILLIINGFLTFLYWIRRAQNRE